MCRCAPSTADGASSAVSSYEQPTSTHVHRFMASLPGFHPDDEVDRRVEDLLDEGLVGGDPHLAAAVPIVANLHHLVLVQVEAGHRLLILDEADDVPTVGVEHAVDLLLVGRILLDQDLARVGSEGDVTTLVHED